MKFLLVFIFFICTKTSSSRERPGYQSPIPSRAFFDPLARSPPRTPCERELRIGRYPIAIAAEFPPLADGIRSVISSMPNRNMFCICSSPTRMVCSIICTSQEMQRIVRARLSPDLSPEQLHPFTQPISRGDVGGTPEYVHPDADPPVTAALIIFHDVPISGFETSGGFQNPQFNASPLDTLPQLSSSLPRWDRPFPIQSQSEPSSRPEEATQRRVRRSDSSPSAFHFPIDYMPLSICTDGEKGLSCPITHNEFEAGQIVYILKRERAKALEGNSVGCISAEGMRRLKEMNESFRDPLRRTGDELLSISQDYDAFILSADPVTSSESSSDSPSQVSQKEREKSTQSIRHGYPSRIIFDIIFVSFAFIVLTLFLNFFISNKKKQDADTFLL